MISMFTKWLKIFFFSSMISESVGNLIFVNQKVVFVTIFTYAVSGAKYIFQWWSSSYWLHPGLECQVQERGGKSAGEGYLWEQPHQGGARNRTRLGGLSSYISRNRTWLGGLSSFISENRTWLGGLSSSISRNRTWLGGLSSFISRNRTWLGGLSSFISENRRLKNIICVLQMSLKLLQFVCEIVK